MTVSLADWVLADSLVLAGMWRGMRTFQLFRTQLWPIMAIPHFWRVMGHICQNPWWHICGRWTFILTSAFDVTTRAFLGVMIRATWVCLCIQYFQSWPFGYDQVQYLYTTHGTQTHLRWVPNEYPAAVWKWGTPKFHGKKHEISHWDAPFFVSPKKTKHPTNCVIPVWNAEHIYMTYPIKSRCSIVNSIGGAWKGIPFDEDRRLRAREVGGDWAVLVRCDSRDRRRLSRRGIVCLKIRCPIHCEIIIFNINLSFWGVPHFQTHPYDGLSWWPHLLFFL